MQEWVTPEGWRIWKNRNNSEGRQSPFGGRWEAKRPVELQRISNPQICRDKSGTFSQLQPDLLKSDVGENRIFAKLIRFSE